MNYAIKAVLIFILLLLPSQAYAEEYENTLDYIQKTSKLWGISECIVNKDGSITLIDSKDKGYGYALGLTSEKGEWLDKITLRPRESCTLTDGHHAFITYKFIGLENDKPVIEVVDKFDARSFGAEVTEKKGKVIIIPYQESQ